jgi:hypothetical protein
MAGANVSVVWSGDRETTGSLLAAMVPTMPAVDFAGNIRKLGLGLGLGLMMVPTMPAVDFAGNIRKLGLGLGLGLIMVPMMPAVDFAGTCLLETCLFCSFFV